MLATGVTTGAKFSLQRDEGGEILVIIVDNVCSASGAS